MSEFGDNLFMEADSHAAGLDCESARRPVGRGYNEENHGDNGLLSVTCARGVTHRIARDGFLRKKCVRVQLDTLVGTIAYQRGLISPTFTEFQSPSSKM